METYTDSAKDVNKCGHGVIAHKYIQKTLEIWADGYLCYSKSNTRVTVNKEKSRGC